MRTAGLLQGLLRWTPLQNAGSKTELVMVEVRASISWYTNSEAMPFSCAGCAVPPVPLWLFHLHWLPTADSGIFFFWWP